MHLHFCYNYLCNDKINYNVHYEYLYYAFYRNALSEVLPELLIIINDYYK